MFSYWQKGLTVQMEILRPRGQKGHASGNDLSHSKKVCFNENDVLLVESLIIIANFSIFISSSRSQILYELATCIKGAVDADGFNLYIVSESHNDYFKYVRGDKRTSEEDIP